MTAHRTAGQLRALRELCALARTALSICDLLAERGAEESDAPRLWLLSLERWTRGEETGPQLGATTRAMKAWQPGAYGADNDPARFGRWQWSWAMALGWLDDARGDLMRNPGHSWHTGRVCEQFVSTIVKIASEPPDAAEARVRNALDHHRRTIGEECARAEADARLRQAKADKATAERALGTLPGME